MITPNLLSISTDMAHMPVGIAIHFYPAEPESLLSRPFLKKHTKCTTAAMPASTNLSQSY